MHAFFCDWVRARTKLGMAISASVNPCVLDVLFFMLTFSFCFGGVNRATSGFIIIAEVVHGLLAATASGVSSSQDANRPASAKALRHDKVRKKGPGFLPEI